MTLLELAERCEQASGPSAELDALIRAALFAPEGATVKQSPINGAWCIYSGEDRLGKPRLFDRPMKASWEVWMGEYTRSLDAAMSLVPEGFGWRLWVPNSESPEPHPFVTIWGNGRSHAPRDTIAATPALALTAACLRARAARDSGSGSQSEDAPKSAAEAEGPQSGVSEASASPNNGG